MRRTFVYCLLALALLVPGATWIVQRSGGTASPVGITAVHAARDAMTSHSPSGSRLADGANTATSTATSTVTSTPSTTATATTTATVGSATTTGTATNTGTVTTTGTTTQTPTVTSTPTIGSATTTSTATTTGTVAVAPAISVSTASAFPGAQVLVTGSNFAPNTTITFFLGSTILVTANGQPVVSSSTGTFSATVVLPAGAAAGIVTLSAQDNVHGLVGVTITVLAGGMPTATGTVLSGNFTLNPAAGPPGSGLSIVAPAGSFAAGSTVTVVFRDVSSANAPTSLGSGSANADGSFTLNGILPPQAVAGNAVIVLASGSTSLARTFTVQPRLTISPASAAPGSAVQVSGSGFAANATITFTVAGLPGGATTISSGGGGFSTSLTLPATTTLASVTVAASDGTNAANAPLTVTGQGGVPTATTPPGGVVGLPTFPIPAATATQVPGSTIGGPYTLSFAEGYTGQASTNGKATFSEVLNLLNAGTTPAQLTITYYVQGSATPQVVNRTVGANSTLRESVNTDIGLDRVVSAVIRSSQRIYATRTITRTAPGRGPLDGSTTQAARAAGHSWYFPEGFTGINFQEYLTVLNPSTSTAHVLVQLAPQASSGANARVVNLTVPPLSRATANIRSLNHGGKATSVGMIVSADQPVVAERVEYFGDGNGSGKYGSTVSLGQTGPTQQLRIAYGSSGGAQLVKGKLQPVGDQDYITLLNPSTNLAGAPVQVTVGFSDSSGHALGRPAVVSVAPGTRQTVGANVTIGSRAAGPFSVSVSANGPIVAESAQYYGGSPNVGSTSGVAFPAYSAALLDGLLSELSTASASGASINRQVFLYNPNGTPLQITATYFGTGGMPKQASYAVPAAGIAVVNVNQAALGLPIGPLGAEFRVSGGSGGFVGYAVGRTTDGRSATEDVSVLPQ